MLTVETDVKITLPIRAIVHQSIDGIYAVSGIAIVNGLTTTPLPISLLPAYVQDAMVAAAVAEAKIISNDLKAA